MKHLHRAGLLGVVILLAACSSSGVGPAISDARLGMPTGPNAALYFTAEGYGTDDSLISARTEVADSVELHETTHNQDGTMSMEPVALLELPAQGELVLEPGGYHLMLVDADRLEVGDRIEVSLLWEYAGEETIVARVVDPADVMGDEMDGSG